MTIVAKIDTTDLLPFFERLINNSTNLRPALAAIEQEMLDSAEETFEREGRPKWPRLSPATERARAAKSKTGKMLQVTGRLATSVQSGGMISGTTVSVGTNVPYAPYLQFGVKQYTTPKQRVWLGMNLGLWKKVGAPIKLPPRPFLELRKETIRAAGEILAQHLLSGL